MSGSRAKTIIGNLLATSDIEVNGSRSWDIQVHESRFYARVLAGGSLALGESYMDGWWDCPALDQFFGRILASRTDKHANSHFIGSIKEFMSCALVNAQSRARSFFIGKHHYDLGNELFAHMLDSGLNYSCGYWEQAGDLEQAQEAKLNLICRKIHLKPGMKVLDIGCGWGGFAKYAAEKFGVSVCGITVSKEQVGFAQKACKGLDVKIELKDYRDIEGRFDRIVSVGMFEHVGFKNYRTFMRIVHQALKSQGLFLLHTIGSNTSQRSIDPWMSTYIFPNSMLPSARQITKAAEGFFVLEDWHSFGHCYDRTLMAWHKNFTDSWDTIKHAYDERFYRMWTYYLLACAGSFRARRNQLWQINR